MSGNVYTRLRLSSLFGRGAAFVTTSQSALFTLAFPFLSFLFLGGEECNLHRLHLACFEMNFIHARLGFRALHLTTLCSESQGALSLLYLLYIVSYYVVLGIPRLFPFRLV